MVPFFQPLKLVSTLEDNGDLSRDLLNMSMPNVRLFNVTLSSGYNATVRLFVPPEITVETFTSYPLIVEV